MKKTIALELLAAYEALWDRPQATFRTIGKEFSNRVDSRVVEEYKQYLSPILSSLQGFDTMVNGDGRFPDRLNDARYPLKLLYFQGNWDLTRLPSVSVIGTRQPSPEGVRRTQYLVKQLVQDQMVIVSGLARGIDTVAHTTAMEMQGSTIAVIGTPLNVCYPPENRALQKKIADGHLLISQIPFLRYAKQSYIENRLFFPERNVTMSALTDATIIVEAGEKSGTLVQAKAALEQKRKLFILENNFLNPLLSWPQKLFEEGAIRVKDYGEIRNHLKIVNSSIK
jgi:DNA processing protein